MTTRFPGGNFLHLLVWSICLTLVRPGVGFNEYVNEFLSELAEVFSWGADSEPPLLGDPAEYGFSFEWRGVDGRGWFDDWPDGDYWSCGGHREFDTYQTDATGCVPGWVSWGWVGGGGKRGFETRTPRWLTHH